MDKQKALDFASQAINRANQSLYDDGQVISVKVAIADSILSAVAEEREACALIAEEWDHYAAVAIRARSN